MIAHIRQPRRRRPSASLVRARRLVAAALLPSGGRRPASLPAIRWRAWTWAGWILLAAAAYLACRLLWFAPRAG
ncbi:MAG: hypothetical protein ABSF26_05115 [Thermoguttaceae bacterium]|jgi:hypothetical protein